jgi:hypothetical protein
MNRLTLFGVAVLGAAFIVASVFAVWASVGDAPWESEATCAESASPCPSQSQEGLEKVACLQGGGEWTYVDTSNAYHKSFCGSGAAPCWTCQHRP